MITLLIRLFLALSSDSTDVTHDRAHHACEVAVYAVLAPEARDDECTLLGEHAADVLCRREPGQWLFGDYTGRADPPLPWCPHNPAPAPFDGPWSTCEQDVVDECVEHAAPDGSTDCMSDGGLAFALELQCGIRYPTDT